MKSMVRHEDLFINRVAVPITRRNKPKEEAGIYAMQVSESQALYRKEEL